MKAIESLERLYNYYTLMMWLAGLFTVLMGIIFLIAYVKLIIVLIKGI